MVTNPGLARIFSCYVEIRLKNDKPLTKKYKNVKNSAVKWVTSEAIFRLPEKTVLVDRLSPSFLKDGTKAMRSDVTKLVIPIWRKQQIPVGWGESVIHKKRDKSLGESHGGGILANIKFKLIVGIIVRRLLRVRETCMGENRAHFWPGRGCID